MRGATFKKERKVASVKHTPTGGITMSGEINQSINQSINIEMTRNLFRDTVFWLIRSQILPSITEYSEQSISSGV